MYYIVYKITNKINGKEYIGAHKTSDLNDGYMGSGKHLANSQKKYGLENFSKEIIFRAVSQEAMYFIERMLVDEEYVARDDTYNLKLGGSGGFDYINSNSKNLYFDENGKCLNGNVKNFQKVISLYGSTAGLKKAKGIEEYVMYCNNISKALKNKYRDGYTNPFSGKIHTDDTKSKISASSKIKQKGEKNSQFGKVWISHVGLKISFSVHKDNLYEYILDGFIKKRIINFSNFDKINEPKISNIKIDEKIDKEKELIRVYSEYYKIYSELGFKKFVEITNYKFSQANLVMRFKKLVPDFLPQNGKKRGN